MRRTQRWQLADAKARLGSPAFCKACVHSDSLRCMQERLKPGHHSDDKWEAAGAPHFCYCACHLKGRL